jgi:hypothetical protein
VIVFFVWRDYGPLLSTYFETWGARLADRVRLIWYEDLARLDAVPGAATYVFADLERLSSDGRGRLADLADRLGTTEVAPRIVNHPGRALLRYELLQALHEHGVNPFRAHRLPLPDDVRFPVFLRDEHDHAVLTPLLRTRREVERNLVGAYLSGHDLASLIAVEFEDVSDGEGLYHRHIAYVIGDQVVSGHLAFGSDWIVKGGPFLDGARLEEQLASVVSDERGVYLRGLADLAGVAYGRFDYAVVDGHIRVWELNTNPTLLLRPEEHGPFALEQVEPVAERLTEAFERLAGDGGDLPPVRLTPGRPLVRPQRRRRALAFVFAWEPARLVLRPAAPLVTRAWLAARRLR